MATTKLYSSRRSKGMRDHFHLEFHIRPYMGDGKLILDLVEIKSHYLDSEVNLEYQLTWLENYLTQELDEFWSKDFEGYLINIPELMEIANRWNSLNDWYGEKPTKLIQWVFRHETIAPIILDFSYFEER